MSYWNGTQWAPEEPAPSKRTSRSRRLLGATLEATLIVALTSGLIAGTALAAKGGSKGPGKAAGGTISLVMVTDANADGVPNYLDEITFAVQTTATDVPMVGLRCWQGSNFVHDGYIALYDASWLSKTFVLGSSYWDPASTASCTARLFYYDNRGRERVLATVDFAALP